MTTRQQLAGLAATLPDAGLAVVLPFNRVYLAVTEAVEAAAAQRRFEDNEAVTTAVAHFAHYYLVALAAGPTGQAPPAWQALFDLRAKAGRQQLRGVVLGVQAHINNDLPQALTELERPLTYADHATIGRSILEHRPAIIAAGRLSPAQSLDPAAGWCAKQFLLAWRRRAWLTYQALEAGRTNRASIEQAAGQTARRLERLPWPY